MSRRLTASILLLFGLVQGALADTTDGVVWGAISGNMRLGLGRGVVDSDGHQTLRVLFENTGDLDQAVLIGYESGVGMAYSFKFLTMTATGASGTCQELNSFTPIAGFVKPTLKRIGAHQTTEVRIPLATIVCSDWQDSPRMDALSRRGGISVQVTLKAEASEVDSVRRSGTWTGMLESGVLTL